MSQAAFDMGCAVVPRRADALPSEQLCGVVGGLRYPLLLGAYEAGAAFEGEIPRWARPALDAVDCSEASRRLFGTTATRAVVRAFGTWCTSPTADGRRLSWGPLAVAVATAQVFEPDELATVLGFLESQETVVLSVDDVGLLRSTASLLGRRTFEPIACEALRDEVLRRFVQACGLVRTVRHALRPPFPTRLEELERAAVALAVPAPMDPVEPARARRPQRQQPRAQVAPVEPPPPAGGFRYPPDVRALEGVRVGDATLCVPHTERHLATWSRALRNCLDSYADQVRGGDAIVIGVRVDGMLTGALELDRQRRLVQVEGAWNRPLAAEIRRPVLHALVERGVMRGRAAASAE